MALVVKRWRPLFTESIRVLRLFRVVGSIIDRLRKGVTGHQFELLSELAVYRQAQTVVMRVALSLELIDCVVLRIEALLRKHKASKLLRSGSGDTETGRVRKRQGHGDMQICIYSAAHPNAMDETVLGADRPLGGQSAFNSQRHGFGVWILQSGLRLPDAWRNAGEG